MTAANLARKRFLWWPARCSDGRWRCWEFVVEHRRIATTKRGVLRNGEFVDVPHRRTCVVSRLPVARL